MEIRVIKRDQVIKNESSTPAAKPQPEKNFARAVESMIADVRKKNDAERRMDFKTVFRPQMRTSGLT